MTKIVGVSVAGLLGQFDHSIAFPSDWPFVIVYGPNGVGKTKFLELIHGVLRANFTRIAATPFHYIEFTFDDGTVFSIARRGKLGGDSPSEDEDDTQRSPLLVSLERPGAAAESWDLTAFDEVPASVMRRIEARLPVRRITGGGWRDRTTDEVIGFSELLDRYSEIIEPILGSARIYPKAVSEFLSGVNVHLIETQRLAVATETQRSSYGERERGLRPTVEKYSEDLRILIATALAENSRISQQLDRTFPGRVLETTNTPVEVSEAQIRERYDLQDRLRKRLSEIAVIDTTADVSLPRRDLRDWERTLLWTYLSDTDKKLEAFEWILARVELFKDIINSHFRFKQLHIDPAVGFRFETESGRILNASSLSSGEQHELVMTYDLLFNAHPEMLVLMDEPEISLHVAWQMRFLDDLIRMSELSSLRFIIATHSPQIIDKWWERTVELGSEQDGVDV